MNRFRGNCKSAGVCIPHASGDEPGIVPVTDKPASVYPTRVGMNRGQNQFRAVGLCIPHASGDEPKEQLDIARLLMYTPREWG